MLKNLLMVLGAFAIGKYMGISFIIMCTLILIAQSIDTAKEYINKNNRR